MSGFRGGNSSFIKKLSDAAMVVESLVGTDFSEGNQFPNADDWALLRLDKPLGELYGVLWVNPFPVSVLAEELYSQLDHGGLLWGFPSRESRTTEISLSLDSL
ncbi:MULTISPECIES: hypothetical protein [unclassified Coleofasciculus]|uniref:hypothetical protein n=1 Tax=unclassified Coleofasciculus TaxID=2692782 RepID=UPI001881FEC2|nr:MULTISPECIES: hypothetical protein [unclassified Coleofasciculus]MBE9128051.1 hypothetical protein [Coleofasciculus sp. LEGE 07081]MBE9149346.1 hypothetical protein [Coleofasciculus sp. LEGE 07092]